MLRRCRRPRTRVYKVSSRLPFLGQQNFCRGTGIKSDRYNALMRAIFGSRHHIASGTVIIPQACNLRELRATQITDVRRDSGVYGYMYGDRRG